MTEPLDARGRNAGEVMTGWHFRVGYLSGDTYLGSKEDAWHAMRMAAIVFTGQNIHQVLPGESREELRRAADFLSSAMKIWIEPGDSVGQIILTASGDGEWRAWKERIARAFTRTLINEMHAIDIDICIEVT